MPKPVHLYFIAEPPAPGSHAKCGPVKIGIASDVNRRIYGLRAGNPRELSVLGSIVFSSRDEARRAEKALHDELAAHRMAGEWFAPAPAVLAYIGRHARPFARTGRKRGPVQITLRRFGTDRVNCPECDGEPVVFPAEGGHRVRCYECHRTGPVRHSYDLALEAWNAAEGCTPGALRYRSQRPVANA